MHSLLPPANEVCEGHVFTGVCLSTGGGGVCPIACWDTLTPGPEQTHSRHQRQTPPLGLRQTPQDQTPPPGPEADTSPGTRGRHLPWDQRQTPSQDQRQIPPRADTSQDQRQTPPQEQSRHPWDQTLPRTRGRHPPKPEADTPQSRDPLGPKADTPPGPDTPWDQRQTPSGPETDPPDQTPPPSAVHAGRYGQQVCGTHPIGMHSCLFLFQNIFSHRSPLQETSETCEFLISVRFV